MKVVINKCYGGFGLSHKAVMRYAELAGFTLYSYVEKRVGMDLYFTHYVPYVGQETFLIHYSKFPLNDDGTLKENGYWYHGDLERNDPLLVQVVEELGDDANGDYAELKVVEIPDGTEFVIDEYDGIESIHETHQSWY